MQKWLTYEGERTREIVFPLGGIGTGCVGLAGNGRLLDWEIANRPNKGSVLGHSHLAVKAVRGDELISARALQGDLLQGLPGQYGLYIEHCHGYGFGPYGGTMCGFPHFERSVFEARFPFARLTFEDKSFPGPVRLLAFNPFIPLDADASGLPAAFFEITFENPEEEPVAYTAAFSLRNWFDAGNVNRAERTDGRSFLRLEQTVHAPDAPEYGELVLAAEGDAQVQESWFRGHWFDGPTVFWNQFATAGLLPPRRYETPGGRETGTLAVSAIAPPRGRATVRFVLAWHFPNQVNDWSPPKEGPRGWKNHYATRFGAAKETAAYALDHWDSLARRSEAFSEALFSATVPEAVLDAASANLSVLKTATVLRLEDGSLYGWEGVREHAGSCEGTCTHVWNYNYATPFLFPSLERSMRENEYRYNLWPNGRMSFRLQLPLGRPYNTFAPCVDGQMGGVIKVYREWKLSGDTEWLRGLWPGVKKSLEYAWAEDNPWRWDLDRDGVMEGRQHHTLDMELFGPSAWLQGFYLGALKAAAEMADFLGEPETAAAYRDLYEKGRAFTDRELFNGSYYEQKIDLADRSLLAPYPDADAAYWNEEAGEIKYQIGQGSAIDQLCAQWHANLCGLGDLFDPAQRRKALRALYAINFKPCMRDVFNPCRVFSLNGEAGAVICDAPADKALPAIAVPYAQETMTGFEYQLGALMIGEGLVEEGLAVVAAVRDRFDGKKRNPWNEFECGSNYARSMASFSLLAVYAGFSYDLPRGMLGFDPMIDVSTGVFQGLWCVDSGWGTARVSPAGFSLRLIEGHVALERLALPFACNVRAARVDGQAVLFERLSEAIRFTDKLRVTEGVELAF